MSAFTTYGDNSFQLPDPLYDERGYRLLKYDGDMSPIYVHPKEYNAVMGVRKNRKATKRKPRRNGKGKRR